MDNTVSDSFYTLQEIAGRGRGLIAAANFTKGTRILSESPLFKVPRGGDSKDRLRESVSQAVAGLIDEQRREFPSLHNSFEEDGPEFSRVRTNALPLGSHATEGGLFLHSSHINHSCIKTPRIHGLRTSTSLQFTLSATLQKARRSRYSILQITKIELRAIKPCKPNSALPTLAVFALYQAISDATRF